MFTNMCFQAEIFKYSNLIKTKKNSKHKTRKLSIFLIRYYRWREYFWVLFFVSVLNGTWGVEFSCETVNCCLIEMSNIPSQNPGLPFIVESSTHQMNRMQGNYTSNKIICIRYTKTRYSALIDARHKSTRQSRAHKYFMKIQKMSLRLKFQRFWNLTTFVYCKNRRRHHVVKLRSQIMFKLQRPQRPLSFGNLISKVTVPKLSHEFDTNK